MTNNEKEMILTMRSQNITYATIAEKLGMPVGTIKTFCRRANNAQLGKDKANLCKNCGAVLKQSTSPRARVFCSDHCKQTWWNKHRQNRKSEKITRTQCLVCGKAIIDYSTNNRKYCSTECYKKRGAGNA